MAKNIVSGSKATFWTGREAVGNNIFFGLNKAVEKQMYSLMKTYC